jgi:hypothetical protein
MDELRFEWDEKKEKKNIGGIGYERPLQFFKNERAQKSLY